MNIKRAKQEIKNSIRAYLSRDELGEYAIPSIRQRPILLMGPPGIGKTQIMEQIAGECDLALVAYTITHHTRQSAIGLPFIKEKEYGGKQYSITEYTMSEIIASVYDKMEASGKKEGILFIDEINCVSETLAPTMLQFLQCKSFGNQKVPEGWIIVAAGNPPEYNKSVREFDVVTQDRVKVINVEADYGVWKEYAYQVGMHGSITSYLDIRKENFYRMETTVDGKQFVTARGWEDLSEMIYAYERLNMKMDREVIIQYLQHPRAAKDFANYLELYYKYKTDYQIDEILSGCIREGALQKLKFAQFDEHLQVIGLLLSRLNENFRNYCSADDRTAELFSILKTYRQMLDSEQYGSDTPDAVMDQLLVRRQREMQANIQAGQNEKSLKRKFNRIFSLLEAYKNMLHDQGFGSDANGRDQAYALIREEFAKETDALESMTDQAMQQLEYAFDFMEAAFGSSQEMVVFITELSVSPFAMRYLREHDCPRFFMYNKDLLFENQHTRIREQLEAIRDKQIKDTPH